MIFDQSEFKVRCEWGVRGKKMISKGFVSDVNLAAKDHELNKI